MTASYRSYWKGTALAFVLFVVCTFGVAALSFLLHATALAVAAASGMTLAASAALGLAAAGLVVIRRERRFLRGRPDLFLELNDARSERALSVRHPVLASPLRRALSKALLGHELLVGDVVQVRSLREIRASLDASNSLDGLPFMEEMVRFCGQRAVVFRCIEKIYDYGRSKRMRRIDDCVLLLGLRCDGADHGGCQAACYLIWKTAWLQRIAEPRLQGVAAATTPQSAATMLESAVEPSGPTVAQADANTSYRCQFTTLTEASTPLRWWDLGRDLRPLFCGNVTWHAFAVALATRWFNFAQRLYGGATFPSMPPVAPEGSAPAALWGGERVRVRSGAEIAASLNRQNKHRGLWFDRDMLKHCQQHYQVLGRVERIIDIGSSKIVSMKTPCIVLDGVHYSGEFQGFGAQHDYLYWREAWLERVEACVSTR